MELKKTFCVKDFSTMFLQAVCIFEIGSKSLTIK